MAARLGDEALAGRLIAGDPACSAARVNAPGYAAVPEFNIYCWTLGFGVSPHEVALKHGHRGVYDRLIAASPARVLLMEAAMRGDEPAVRGALAEDPSLIASLTTSDHAQLAQAIFHGRFAAAALMLRLGFDPKARGTDGGTALHMACWMGHVPLVAQLLSLRVPIDDVDPTHGGTPLGWAAFGSVHRCAEGADYVGVIERLIAAGANMNLAGNGAGRSMIQMAEGNADVQAVLRRHLAR
jgi:ankyrin repeat protein